MKAIQQVKNININKQEILEPQIKIFSVIRVGRELTEQLKSYGYNIIHDENYHDYPSYTGSYTSSLNTVTKLLEENKNTDIVIDVHRDAVGDNKYAPTVKIGDEYAAQIMFVVGGNGSSIPHPKWQQNLKFAIKVQQKANRCIQVCLSQ